MEEADDTSELDIFRYAPRHVLVVLFSVFLLMICVSNISVLFVLISSAKMRTATNTYIISICVASLLVGVFTCASSLHELTGTAKIGTSDPIVCVTFVYLEILSITACVFSFTATAVDRYRTIVQSHKPRFSLKTTYFILAGVWIFALAYGSRGMFERSETFKTDHDGEHNETSEETGANNSAGIERSGISDDDDDDDDDGLNICSNFLEDESGDFIYRVIDTVVIFLIPLLIMMVLYGRVAFKLWSSKVPTTGSSLAKRKTIRLLLIIVGLFFFCWSPFHVFEVAHDALEIQGLELEKATFAGARVWSLILAISNSWLNPIVYCCLNRNFRVELKAKLALLKLRCIHAAPVNTIHPTTETTGASD